MTYPIDSIYAANMNDQQRAWFHAEYQSAHKDEAVGVLFAVFLGGLGIHHFYLRRDGLGILYLVFSWTGIPMIIAWVEAFFMPSRVRQYNAAQALYISNQILAAPTGTTNPNPDTRTWTPPTATATVRCDACDNPVDPTAVFCNHCGAAVTHPTVSNQAPL